MIMDIYSLTDNMILSKIGEFIKRQRLERNISQKDFAHSAGVSISSVASLERGESVSLKTLIPLLRALGALHMLAVFLKEPEISPIAYAKQLENQKSRKRASTTKNNNNNQTESEW
ncbi:MAG: helix-turn-helix transcriptional regulator [Bacteroidaceae bacterium]|nr:helix-turn-helix transcriptional regulator [Bacteroidaceae bacterium]